jgi:cytochrome c553
VTLLRAGNAAALAVAFLFAGSACAVDPNLCAACHGVGGNSTNPEVPTIAGQPRQFIATALFQFREGDRKDPQMTPMAVNLSNAEMNELAAHFAAQKFEPAKHESKAESAQAGPALAKKFMCTQCHGAQLLGQQHIPRLAGQQFQYLRNGLSGFRQGKRSDPDGKMTESARPLSDQDVEVLADYLSGLK